MVSFLLSPVLLFLLSQLVIVLGFFGHFLPYYSFEMHLFSFRKYSNWKIVGIIPYCYRVFICHICCLWVVCFLIVRRKRREVCVINKIK